MVLRGDGDRRAGGERIADPEREIALEDAERLRERLQRGEERLFAVSLYLLVRAKALRELDDLTRRVEEQLDALLAHSRLARWEQERGYRSCLPEARDQLLVPRNLDTSALAATLPFVGPSLAMETPRAFTHEVLVLGNQDPQCVGHGCKGLRAFGHRR